MNELVVILNAMSGCHYNHRGILSPRYSIKPGQWTMAILEDALLIAIEWVLFDDSWEHSIWRTFTIEFIEDGTYVSLSSFPFNEGHLSNALDELTQP